MEKLSNIKMDNWISISRTKIGLSLISIFGDIGIFAYYLYSQEHMSKNLADKTASHCFVFYIINMAPTLLIPLFDTRFMIFLRMNNIYLLPEEMWNILKPTNHPAFKLIKIFTLVNFGLGIYFMTLFIPFNKGCHDYDYHMCSSFRMISIIEILNIIYSSIYLYNRISSLQNTNNRQINRHTHQLSEVLIANVRQDIINALPITTVPLNDDNVCSICLEIKENDTRKTLNCGHKFHPECINVSMFGYFKQAIVLFAEIH